jgi:hypothetical protein
VSTVLVSTVLMSTAFPDAPVDNALATFAWNGS